MIDCTPCCPWCNTPRHVRTSGTSYRAWYCGRCQREFEAEDDGTIGYGPPSRRIEREERQAAKAAEAAKRRTKSRILEAARHGRLSELQDRMDWEENQ